MRPPAFAIKLGKVQPAAREDHNQFQAKTAYFVPLLGGSVEAESKDKRGKRDIERISPKDELVHP